MKWLSSIRGILIDLSGTLHIGEKQVGTACEALKVLRSFSEEHHIKVRFLSNTSQQCRADVVQKLNSIGFDVTEDELTTSLSAAAALVKDRQLNPLLLLSEEAQKEFGAARDLSLPKDAVIVGLAPPVLDYDRMNQAFQLVSNGAPLLAAHKGRYYRDPEGNLSIGPGAFVTGLEYSTGATAQVIGKPNKEFFETAFQQLVQGTEIRPDEVVMIGDDLNDDVRGAEACGLRGCLVRSGKYREGDDSEVSDDTLVVDDFSSFVEQLIQSR